MSRFHFSNTGRKFFNSSMDQSDNIMIGDNNPILRQDSENHLPTLKNVNKVQASSKIELPELRQSFYRSTAK